MTKKKKQKRRRHRESVVLPDWDERRDAEAALAQLVMLIGAPAMREQGALRLRLRRMRTLSGGIEVLTEMVRELHEVRSRLVWLEGRMNPFDYPWRDSARRLSSYLRANGVKDVWVSPETHTPGTGFLVEAKKNTKLPKLPREIDGFRVKVVRR